MALNQYTQVTGDSPATLSWDANGNLTSDGATTFYYDTENRLTSASGARYATLSYDPLGRLYQVASPSGTTRFLYDGDRLIAEYNSSGSLLRRYVHGIAVDERSSGTKERLSRRRAAVTFMLTTKARSSGSRRRRAPRCRSTRTTPTA